MFHVFYLQINVSTFMLQIPPHSIVKRIALPVFLGHRIYSTRVAGTAISWQ